MHDTPYILHTPSTCSYVSSYVRSRIYHVYGVFGIILTAVNNVPCYVKMVYWQCDRILVRMHSFSFVLEVRGPTKNPE